MSSSDDDRFTIPATVIGSLLVTVTWVVFLALLAFWIPAYLVLAVLYLLGWLVVPVLSITGYVRVETVSDPNAIEDHHFILRIEHWRSRLFFPWDNSIDGVDGPEVSGSISTQRWIEKYRDSPAWVRRIMWSLFRNPVGNDRELPFLGLTIDPDRVVNLGNSGNPHEDWKKYVTEQILAGVWKGWKIHALRPLDVLTAAGVILNIPPKWFISISRQGSRCGVWFLRCHSTGHYSELRLGWGVIPAPLPGREKVGLKLQLHIKRAEIAVD